MASGTTSRATLTAGSMLADRYRVERELGRGGMAIVFLAEDLKHHRRVAIKLLHPELSSTLASERFLREITLAARLSHPNILALHDSGEVDGVFYYVMPYVPGKTLRERLDGEGALAASDALLILREVADALTHAHAKGIIHRDVKPENILISGGHAIVSDFGIARAVDAAGGERLTATGLAIGTPAYMSPEQAAGVREVDARSDVYSLGCVAYEMLAGAPPFTGGSPQAIMARHALDKPLPMRTVRPTVSEAMDVVIEKALAKVPGDRFTTPVQFVEALTRAHTRGEVKASWRPTLWLRQRRHRLTAATAILALAALAMVLTREWLAARAARVTSLAILPFDNIADSTPNYFTLGMQNALRGAIAQVKGVGVIGGSANVYRGSTKADTTIARELGVDALVHATLVHAGDSVHLQVSLIRTRPSERLLWSQAYDRDIPNIMAMYRDIARDVARTVAAELPSSASVSRARPVNAEAYEAYLQGTYYLRMPQRDSQEKGLAYLRNLVERNQADPLAYAGLATGYAQSAHSPFPLPDALTYGRAAALRAVALDSTLPDGWSALAIIKEYLEWDWPGAERAFRRALELNPSLAVAHWHYSYYLALFDRMDEAIAEARRAVEIDPFNVAFTANLADLYSVAGRYDEALKEARKALAVPSSGRNASEARGLSLTALAHALAGKGQYQLAIAAADSARRMHEGLTSNLVYLLVKAGRTDEARQVLVAFERLPITPTRAWNRAVMNGWLGNSDEFFRWIEYEPHHAWVPWIRNFPATAPTSIRQDQRFARQMRRMNLPMPRATDR